MVRLFQSELMAYKRETPLLSEEIRPILIILSPRDIDEAIEAFKKIDYIDKVWFKYFSKPNVVKEINLWVSKHPEYTHIVLVLDDVECPYDSVKILLNDLLYYNFPVLCGCFNFCNVWVSGLLYCTWCEEGKDHEFINVTFDPVKYAYRHSGPEFHFVTEKWRKENPIIKKIWFQGFPLAVIRRDIFFQVGLKVQDEKGGLFCSDLPWAIDCARLGIEQFCDFKVKLIHHGDKRNRELSVGIKKSKIIFDYLPTYERALEDYKEYLRVKNLFARQVKEIPRRPPKNEVILDEFYTKKILNPEEWDEVFGRWSGYMKGEKPKPDDYKYKKIELKFEEFIKDKLDILCVIDQWGWAFDFEGRGLSKYSRHNVMVRKYCEVSPEDYGKSDIVLIMHPSLWSLWNLRHRGLLKGKKKFIMSIRCSMREMKNLNLLFGAVPLEYIDAIACINRDSLEAVIKDSKFSKIPSYLVYAGVDPDLFKPVSRPSNSFVIGWAGYKERKCKRIYLFDRLGFPLSLKTDWGSEFFVEGRSQQSMVDWYKEIDTYISLSWSEGLPQPILEAMSSGLPIVATPAGAIEDVIDPEWLLIDSQDDDEVIADAKVKLRKLRKDSELRKRVGERNRQLIMDKWSWKHIAKIYDNMFEEVTK